MSERRNSMAKSPRASVAKNVSMSEEDDVDMRVKLNKNVPVNVPNSRPSSRPGSPRLIVEQELYKLQGVFI